MFRGLPTASLSCIQLFSDPYLFTVPAYQRPYSWTTEEAGQLFDDLAAAAGLGESEPQLPDYFLGAILLLDPEADGPAPPAPGNGPRVYQVVDGQQRLATLAILAAALRDSEDADSTDAADTALADRLDGMIQIERDARGTTAHDTRIQLAAGEQGVLEGYILERRAVPAHTDGDASPLAAVYRHLRGEIGLLSREERRRLARYVAEYCHMVLIITRDIDRAHTYFTVLNERGRPLDRKDILKAEILRGLPVVEMAKGLALWQQAQDKLGPGELESLFSHLRFSHGDERAAIIAGTRALVTKHGCLPFLQNIMTPMASALHRLRLFSADPEIQRRPQLYGALNSLARLGKNDWVPPAMVAMALFDRDPELASALLIGIERLAMLLRIRGLGSDKRQRRFARVISAINANPRTAAASPAFDISRDEQKMIGYHLKDIHRRNAPLAKMLLMRLEDVISGSPLTIPPHDLSVEHVLPGRPAPTSNWRKLFPDNVERESCSASLGNLALVTLRQNERAENKDFAQKLSIYRDMPPGIPPFASNAAILQSATWLAPDIRARETHMLETLSALWQIDARASRTASPPADRDVKRA